MIEEDKISMSLSQLLRLAKYSVFVLVSFQSSLKFTSKHSEIWTCGSSRAVQKLVPRLSAVVPTQYYP